MNRERKELEMILRQHGGSCCGMRHISGFVSPSDLSIREFTRTLATLPSRRLAEVVLTHYQLSLRNGKGYGWGDVLASYGFKLVSRFINGNTENEIFVFHYHPSFKSVTENIPFPMRTDYQPAAPAPRLHPRAGTYPLILREGDTVVFDNGATGRVQSTTEGGNARAKVMITRGQIAPMGSWWYNMRDGRFTGHEDADYNYIVEGGRFLEGSRVLVTTTRSMHFGRETVVRGITLNGRIRTDLGCFAAGSLREV